MNALNKRSKSALRQKGQAMVETGLILLVFMSLLIGIVDVGQILFVHQSLVERVRAGMRWGIVNPYDEAAIKNMIVYNSPTGGTNGFLGLTTANVNITRTDTGLPTERIRVAIVGYRYFFVSPLIARTFVNDLAVVETLPTEYRPE